MDARQIFLARHSCVHSKMVDPEGWWKEEDTIWSDVTEEELRSRPTMAHNSIAWLVWHMARCEDVAVNTVLRGAQEVLDRDGWLAELGISSRHIGTSATSGEVTNISHTVGLDALRAYRAAVGRETRRWASTVDFSALSGVVSALDARRAAERHAFGEHAAWVEEHWAARGWRRSDFLFWLAIEHNWFHIGEIWVIRGLLQHAGC
jgi:DinB superfamily